MNDNKLAVSTNETLEGYHQRNCKICRHPDRPAIEYDFLHWRSPQMIGREYNLSSRSVYRHANAVGLLDQRKRNLRSSLELVIENAGTAPVTTDSVLRAIQLYARMNEAGEIAEIPKTQVIVISRDGAPATLPVMPGLRIDPVAAISSQLAAPNGQSAAKLPGQDQSSPELAPSNIAAQPVTPCQTEIGLSN